MNFKRQSKEEVSVNLTPLIDIVFLLLIFFMVSTTFTKENHLTLDLPEASTEAKQTASEVIDIVISASGDYSINDQALVNNSVETLKRAILKTADGRTAIPVIITADAQATHESVVKAMDAAGQTGFVNLSITTRKPSGEK